MNTEIKNTTKRSTVNKKIVNLVATGVLITTSLALAQVAQAQVAVPENPGFTPEQAEAMAAQIRQSKSSDVLYPKNQTLPTETRAGVRIEGSSGGRRWGGIGSAPATAMERQLMHYPKTIQEDILDFLFKPKFGMALTHLKVEVGGDNNSTAAVEPSFAHTREEMAQPNFNRGGNYWLMRKARDRNPGMELGALAWAQPYWVGDGAGRTDNKSFFTPESADYFVKFYEGARKEWGLEMQYFSAEQNERDPSGRCNWVLKYLRPAFDKAGFQDVKFVIDHDGWPMRMEDNNPELLKHIGALGRHYVENEKKKITTPEARASGIPLWNSECFSREGRTWPMAMFFAESVARGYVESKITQFTTWPILAGGLPGSIFGSTGLMMANKPWSGYYEIYPTVWLTAHFNQFAPMGWKALDGGCGARFEETNSVFEQYLGFRPADQVKRARLYYLTLASPDGKDYSIIVVNFSPFARTLDFELKALPLKPLHVWQSSEREQFVRTGQINHVDGKFALGIEPWAVYSLTTTTGQQKGQPKKSIPQDGILALPYSDNFDSYAIGNDARYQSCSAGYFEVYQAPGESKALRQVVPAKGLTWSIPKDNYPCVAIGDVRWSDYEVSSESCLEGRGTAALWARIEFFRDHGMAGYFLRYDQDGKWEFGVARNRHGSEKFYSEKTLASGHLSGFNSQAWHKMAISVDGAKLCPMIDGQKLAELSDNTYSCGAVGYSTWAEGIQNGYEDMKAGMVIGTPYGHARFDNLLVRPIPGKLSQAGWKASASTEHPGHEAGKAIDGDSQTFWHSAFNEKGPLPQTLTVDLGRKQRVKEVRVLQRQDGGHSYITRYALYVSETGKEFARVSDGIWEDSSSMKVISIEPRVCRYLRLEALEATDGRKSNVALAEIQVITPSKKKK